MPQNDERKLDVGIEYPRRYFGTVALEKGYITTDQLWEALVRQKNQKSEGTSQRSLGMILKDLGYLTQSQIEEILEVMKMEEEVK